VTRMIPENSGKEPREGLRINSNFADALTNLVSVIGAQPADDVTKGRVILASWLATHIEDRRFLVEGLTRSLADPAYLALHLRHLRKLRAPMLPYEDLIPDERINRLLARGPDNLTDGELAWLVLSPEQLQALPDEIADNLTYFWVEAVDAAMSQAAHELGEQRLPIHELVNQIQERIGKEFVQPTIRDNEEPVDTVVATEERRSPKILVVEDDKTNRDLLTRHLQLRAYDVHCAVDGSDACIKAQNDPPDLILMDLYMPVLDGWEATRRLKKEMKTSRIPIIAVTAHAVFGVRETAIAAGCDDFVTKPVDYQGLFSKIQECLGKRKDG
jgi:CheY-like chemotaxis protein